MHTKRLTIIESGTLQDNIYNSPNPLVKFFHLARVEKVLDFLGDTKKKRVLELGCGEGFLLQKINGKVFGIDISLERLKLTKKRVKNCFLVVADCAQLPFKEKSFDFFIASEIFEHVVELEKAKSETFRVAKSNAIIVVSFPIELILRFARLMLLRFPLQFKGHVHSLSMKQMENLFGSKPLKKALLPALPFPFPIVQIALFKIKSDNNP